MNLELATWSDAATAQFLQVTVVAIAVGIIVGLMARSRPHLAYLVRGDRYQHLNLGKTRITDEGVAALAGLKELRSLDLSGTGISDAGLEKLQRTKALKSLKVHSTKVTAEGVKKLAALPGLEQFEHSTAPEELNYHPLKQVGLRFRELRTEILRSRGMDEL